jgi:surfeit locus 1 family protein
VPHAHLLAPRFWAVHILAVVSVAAAVWLGSWQYDAWSQRREAEAVDLTRAEPRPLQEVMGPDDPFPGDEVGQPVVVAGSWVPSGTVYVENREQDGRDGVWVVTPVQVGPGSAALLVVRGWSPSVSAAPAPPTGAAEFVAWLQPTEGTRARDDDASDDVLPQLRIADALQHVDQDLYGAYAVVADEVADGDWPHGDTAVNDGTDGLAQASLDQLPEAGRFTALRNLLYAVEWWFFGLFAAFIWWRWMRDELAASEAAVAAT